MRFLLNIFGQFHVIINWDIGHKVNVLSGQSFIASYTSICGGVRRPRASAFSSRCEKWSVMLFGNVTGGWKKGVSKAHKESVQEREKRKDGRARCAASKEAGVPILRSNRPTRTLNGTMKLSVSSFLLGWLVLVCLPTVGSASWTSTTGYLVCNETGPSGPWAGCDWPWLHGAGVAELQLSHSSCAVAAPADALDDVMIGNRAMQLTAVALLFQWFLHQWLLLKGDCLVDGIHQLWGKRAGKNGKIIRSARFCGKRRLKACRRCRFGNNLRLPWSCRSVWSALRSSCARWESGPGVGWREFFHKSESEDSAFIPHWPPNLNFGGGRGGAQGSASTERKRNEKRELAASEKALLDALLGVLQKFQPQSAVGRQAHEASQDQGKGKGKNKGKGSPQNPQTGKGTTSDVSNGGLLNAIIRLVDRAKKNPSGLLQRLEQLTSAAVNGQPLGKKTKKEKEEWEIQQHGGRCGAV